jgi:para-aminobenzoate synthetase component 1
MPSQVSRAIPGAIPGGDATSYHAAMEFDGHQLDWKFDPLEAQRRWPRDRRLLMLHSGRLHRRWARWSILAQSMGSYVFGATPAMPKATSQWLGPRECGPTRPFSHRPFADLRGLLEHATPNEAIWVGYLSYDLGRWIERVPQQAVDDRHWPIIELGYCPGYLAYDGQAGRWLACGQWRHGGWPDLDAAAPHQGQFTAHSLRPDQSRTAYEQAVKRGLDYIAAGDVFQVNLTQRFTAKLDGDDPHAQRAVFQRLASTSPAWYGAYLELTPAPVQPGEDAVSRVIASTSPELFLEVDPHGHVVTRPIKGTRPAGLDPEVLRRSAKDAAELNMIVDLLRNDLGRVCTYGSVRVTEPRAIETHPTVHHGVATVRGKLHKRHDLIDLLRATLPGGSITGAPKVRAMQIIDQLEPVRRGPYCGCIGMISPQQTCLNIAIRTMLIESVGQQSQIDFGVGGGIVADSDPAQEYDETLDKAAAIVTALKLPALRRLDTDSH